MKLKAGKDRIVQIVVNPFHFADFSGVQHGGTARVKGFYLLHVFCIQREIPDFQILFHPFPVNGFWNYDHALLQNCFLPLPRPDFPETVRMRPV